MKTKPQNGNMTMSGNEGLFMFYLSQFMKENVFYIRESDTYVAAETDGDTLILHAIWGEAFKKLGDYRFMLQAISHA